jgi:MlaD protein
MSAREEAGPATAVRVLAGAAVLLAAVLVAILLFGGGGDYRVTAEFVNAGQLVKGGEVRVAGAAVGTVDEIDVSQDGMAAAAWHQGDHQAHLAVGHRQPVHRPAARPRRRRADRRRRPHRGGPDRHGRRA